MTEEQEVLEEQRDPDDVIQDQGTGEEPDTFPREYVEKLRQENGRYRQRAQHADELAHRLHRALVAADGRLQDPTDLDYADDHLDEDGSHLREAIDELLARKPHLAARRPIGDVGQGATSTAGEVNLLGLLGGR
ncbi:hypothetical protein [Gordonia aichiensis]|uniref:hypothetical protein n=1 Tax=Gordonia aichiensis TaxID=36820 RepID=UPI003266EF30